MNHVERFRAVMDFLPVDRLPCWEWAMWWDETIANWKRQGLPAELESVFEIAEYLGLDPYQQFWFSTTVDTIDAVQHHVEGIVSIEMASLSSDVDKNIPVVFTSKPFRYALIIGNEDYSRYQRGLNDESNVEFARNDASIFKEYATKVMGVEEKNL